MILCRHSLAVLFVSIFSFTLIVSSSAVSAENTGDAAGQAAPAEATAPAPQNEAQGELAMPPASQPAAAPATPEEGAKASAAPGAPETYTIKEGDTLWDISSTYLKDPFLWPLIWKENPSIANPDLIYPGNALAIPSLAPVEQAIRAPERAAPVEEARKETPAPAPAPEAPVVREAPSEMPFMGKKRITTDRALEEEARPQSHLILPEETAPPLIDKYAMLNAGFVDQDEDGKDAIVGGLEPKTIFSLNDIILVQSRAKDEVNIGDKFLVYKLGEKIKHPKTGKKFGRLTRVLGVMQVTAKEPSGIVSGRITLSFDAIEKGDRIASYVEPSLVYPSAEARSKDISGYVLAVRDSRALNGQLDFVYLDKGAADGVEQGDRFIISHPPMKKGWPRRIVGEALVFLVKDRTSTAVVKKSTDAISRGNLITYKQ